MEKMFMRVSEVMEALDVSESYAYKLIRKLNKELEKTGCVTIPGRIDPSFFMNSFTVHSHTKGGIRSAGIQN